MDTQRAEAPRTQGSRRATEGARLLRATVLIVEDEPLVRLAVAHYLSQGGCSVLEAGDSDEAIAATFGPAPIDLLISDITLPGPNGLTIAKELRGRLPGLPLIFMSAHQLERLPAFGEVPEGAVLLQKPFTESQLLRLVKELTQ